MKNILARSFTSKTFATALKQTFEGIKARRENIHELMLVAVGRITSDDRDTGWLTQIAEAFEQTAGLSVEKFSLWVKTSVVADVTNDDGTVSVIPALAWDDKTKSFKFARKGLTPRLVCTQKWYEVGAKPSVEKTYNFIGSLENLIKQAEKKLKEGALDDTERALLNAIVGVKVQMVPNKPAITMGSALPPVPASASNAESC